MTIRKQSVRNCIVAGQPKAAGASPSVLAIALAVGLGAAPLTSIAAEDAQRPYSSTQPGAQTETRTGTDASGLKTAGADENMPAGIHKASKLIGYDVKNSQGEDVGSIKDLALDTSQGRVVYAVVSTGGVMGVGGQLHAVPLDAFDSQTTEDALVLNATEEQLSSASGFDDDNWPSSPTWRSDSGTADGGMGDRQGATSMASAGSIVKASEFMDKDVKNANDEDLGDISDLAINIQSGEIVYAVMERGGALGIGEKLVAIPTDALSPGSDDDAVIISATEDQLKNAKGFSDDNWPERAEFAQFETDGEQQREDVSPSVQDPMQPQTTP